MSIKRYKTVSQWTRAKILKRDNYTCQDCGRVELSTFPVRGLQIHHIRPFLDSRDDRPENLTTLCKPCHEAADRDHKSALVKAARAAYLSARGVAAKHVTIQARVTREESDRVVEMASDADLSISDFIRSRIGL